MSKREVREYFEEVGQAWALVKYIIRENNYDAEKIWKILEGRKIVFFLQEISKKGYDFKRFKRYVISLKELDEEREKLERELDEQR